MPQTKNFHEGTLTMKYPIQCKNIIDVTKPPYNADNTGKTDVTAILCSVIDDILIREVDGIAESRKLLEDMGSDFVYRGFENRIHYGGITNVIYPEVVPSARIIYFPAGEYLVSDTVSYTIDNLQNIHNSEPFSELCRGIHIMGEGRDRVTIRLLDNSKGFEADSKKPVISLNTRPDACDRQTTNVAQLNTVEDITIDCGKGNEGAVALRFCSNNSGRMENLYLKSQGSYAGIHTAFSAEATVSNVVCIGFRYGMDIPSSHLIPIDECDFSGCTEAGIITYSSHLNIGRVNWGTIPKVVYREGCGVYHFEVSFDTDTIDTCGNNVYADDCPDPLRANHIPKNIRSENPEDWVCVDDFGAVGDGITDSSVAIERAMNSGKPIVIFGDGHYLINNTVKIPATVKTIDFMFCDLYSGGKLIGGELEAAFDISEDSDDILFMENLYTFEQFFGHCRCVKHSAVRDLVLSDFHNQASASYFNSVPGSRVYLDNVASTIGTYSLDCVLNRKEHLPVYAHMIPYEFHGQKVYGRQVNPERADVEVLNDNSRILFDGLKVEGPGVAVKTINGGTTRINIGSCGIGYKHAENAMFETIDSHAVIRGVLFRGINERLDFNTIIKQTDATSTVRVHKTELKDIPCQGKERLNFYCSDDPLNFK